MWRVNWAWGVKGGGSDILQKWTTQEGQSWEQYFLRNASAVQRESPLKLIANSSAPPAARAFLRVI